MSKTSKLKFFSRPEVALYGISVGAFKSLPHIAIDDEMLTDKQSFQQRKALILNCADITPEEFNTLETPDFFKLYEDICDLILTPSDEKRGQKLTGKDFEFTLLHPFENEAGEKLSTIKFQVPKVVHSEALAELEDPQEREDFMFQVVAGLEPEDFECLSLDDYLALKPQVGAFFQRSAAYFRPATSKA